MKTMLTFGGLAGASALLLTLATAPRLSAASDEFGPFWPEGETAEEVGYFCSACHSLAIVTQQGLDRKRWDDVLQWMISDHGMPELDPETYERFLSFLTENFPEGSQKERVPGRT